VYRLQESELHNQQEQTQTPAAGRVAEVLPALQWPQASQGDEVTVSPGLIIVAIIAAMAAAVALVWRQPLLAFAVKSSAYIRDVREEVRKVSWPTWEDLRKSTMVIIVIVVIVGAIIGLMDLMFQWILIDVFSRIFGG
jgi:preprotein translocase subunit SecE